jgi:hypothetical protein
VSAADCVTGRFEDVDSVRTFRWWRGERHFPGWYWAATTGRHVGFESWLERDRLLLMDFDPNVVGIGSQPFWLHWHNGERERRRAPDYFVRRTDGSAVVVVPEKIVCDHGSVFISHAFRASRRYLGVNLQPAHKATPTDTEAALHAPSIGSVAFTPAVLPGP